jgi:hypothetical protein
VVDGIIKQSFHPVGLRQVEIQHGTAIRWGNELLFKVNVKAQSPAGGPPFTLTGIHAAIGTSGLGEGHHDGRIAIRDHAMGADFSTVQSQNSATIYPMKTDLKAIADFYWGNTPHSVV